MKQIKMKSIAMYITFAVLIVFLTGALSGCFFLTYSDYSGQAVNVKASAAADVDALKDSSDSTVTLVGTVVKLIPIGNDGSFTESADTTITADEPVGSDGSFTFYYLPTNRYKLTGVKDGWTFVPRYIDISGDGSDLPDLLAYPTADAGVITLVTSWEDTDIDVDAILTYGEPETDTTTINDWTTDLNVQNPALGTRTKISWKYPGSTDGIQLDRDVASATAGIESTRTDESVPRVETISIYNDDWLDDGDVAYLYVDSFFDEELVSDWDTVYLGDDYQSLTGEEGTYASAYAQVDVMFGTTHYGTWVLPWNTSETTIKVLRIDYDTDDYDDITGDKDFMIASASNADLQYGGLKTIIPGE